MNNPDNPVVIIDSNIYIDLWQSNRFRENILFAKHRYLIYQCSVVLHELRRGVLSRQALHFVEELLRSSPDILNPTDTDWWHSAQILQTLLGRKAITPKRLRDLQNDCLIALCAKRVRGMVITSDKKDFAILEKVLPCRVLYW